MKLRIYLLQLCLLAVVATPLTANTLYRYKDENGRTVMAASVPPEIVPKGYEILNSQGRVVERVAPALTDEQKRARDAAIAEEKRKQEELAARREEDKKILKQYGDAATAKLIMERRLTEIDDVILSREASISTAQKTIAKNEEKAAEFQRNGRAIPKNVSAEIERAKESIADAQSVIMSRKHSRQLVENEFLDIIERLEMMKAKPVDK